MRAEILWAGGLVAVAGWGAWTATRALWLALRSRAWPRARGEILRADVAHGAKYQARALNVWQWLGASIRYRYRVGHRWRYGDRVRFTDSTVRSVRETVARYPAGAAVEVVYDPEHADRAALEPGPTWLGYVEAAAAAFFLALALAWLAYEAAGR